jgi:hypothetical protein
MRRDAFHDANGRPDDARSKHRTQYTWVNAPLALFMERLASLQSRTVSGCSRAGPLWPRNCVLHLAAW